jgi:hypothetical protein
MGIGRFSLARQDREGLSEPDPELLSSDVRDAGDNTTVSSSQGQERPVIALAALIGRSAEGQ